MNEFYEAATHINHPMISAWKNEGKSVVGYTCSYVPAEIFHAAGILPVRLRGIETDGMEIGDAYYGPFICSFPKCILQLAGKGEYGFLDGAIITPGCDAMRRLDECWRKAGEDYPDAVPDMFYYFDVPHKTEIHGMDWFLMEIRKLIDYVQDHFKVKITDAKLRKSIKLFNTGRKLLGEIEAMRADSTSDISGTDMFAATVAGTVMPRERYNELLETWLAKLKKVKGSKNGKTRLMLVGSISDEVDLVELVESSTDAMVVAENLCFGVRFEGQAVEEKGDPVEALGQHYLGKSVCPRMYGKYKERLALLKDRISRSRVDGVIMQNIRFCDLHGAENALFERDLEAEGVPCLRLEREYGPLIETGRIKLRVNAFLERIER